MQFFTGGKTVDSVRLAKQRKETFLNVGKKGINQNMICVFLDRVSLLHYWGRERLRFLSARSDYTYMPNDVYQFILLYSQSQPHLLEIGNKYQIVITLVSGREFHTETPNRFITPNSSSPNDHKNHKL